MSERRPAGAASLLARGSADSSQEFVDGAPIHRSPAWAVLRRHRVFVVVTVVGSALRVLASVAYQPGLFGGGDSKSYIYNAEHLWPQGFRPAGYPVFLWLLSFTRSLAAVTITQHLLVVATAVAVYLLLLRFGLRPAWAAVATAPLLLDAYQIDAEQFILSDAFAEVLVLGALIVLVWRPRPSIGQTAAAGLVLAMASVTRTVALGILPLAFLYLVIVRVGWQRLMVFAVAAAGLLLAYAGWYDAANHQFTLQNDSGLFLYGRVAPFAECKGLVVPPIERPLCQTSPPDRRPPPGWYDWNHQSPLLRYVPGSQRFRVAKDFAERIIAHQPLTYLSVATADTLHYFAFGHPIGRLDWPVQSSQFPPRHTDPTWQIGLATVGYHGARVEPRFVSPVATILRGYQRFGYTPGPLLAGCLCLAVAASIGTVRRKRRPAHIRRQIVALRHPAVAALLFALAGLATIALASLTAEFGYRYGVFLIPLLPPAGALAIATLLAQRRNLGSGSTSTPATTPLERLESRAHI